eukprot:jgi/Orpsp1_1/1189176/evm.model.d7180000070032.1
MKTFSFLLSVFLVFTLNWNIVFAGNDIYLPSAENNLHFYRDKFLFKGDTVYPKNWRYYYPANAIYADYTEEYYDYIGTPYEEYVVRKSRLRIYFSNKPGACNFSKAGKNVKSFTFYRNGQKARRVCVFNNINDKYCDGRGNLTFQIKTQNGCNFTLKVRSIEQDVLSKDTTRI